MDYTKLSSVVSSITDSKKVETPSKVKVVDSDKFARRKAIRDAVRRIREKNNKEEETKVVDAKKRYAEFKLTDSYKDLHKKIKDELSDTESTEEAIEVVINNLQDAPAEQVLSAVVEVLGEAIDVLQGDSEIEDIDESAVEEEPAAPVEETVEETEEVVGDSAKKVEDSEEKCLIETASEYFNSAKDSKEDKVWHPADLGKEEFSEEEISKAKEVVEGLDEDGLIEEIAGDKDEFSIKFKK